MSRLLAIALLAATVGAAAPAIANEPENGTPRTLLAGLDAVPPLAADAQWPLQYVPPAPQRGALLPALYVSLAAVNAYDAYSTTRGVSNGAIEANPLMRSAARHPAAMWAIKGSLTTTSILIAEQMWRKGRKKAAIATIVVSTAIGGVAVANNARLLRK